MSTLKTIFLISTIILAKQESLDNLILSLEIKNGEEITKYFDSKSEIIIDNKSHKGNRYQQSKILDELGWVPQETFQTGIEKTVRWYLDNYNKI